MDARFVPEAATMSRAVVLPNPFSYKHRLAPANSFSRWPIDQPYHNLIRLYYTFVLYVCIMVCVALVAPTMDREAREREGLAEREHPHFGREHCRACVGLLAAPLRFQSHGRGAGADASRGWFWG